jgi:hypothetical protein
MLRTALLSLILIVSLPSSTSMLRKSVFRRQLDPQYCHSIEGFECKCSYYRVTCTTDRDLQSPITVSSNEKHKYQSVELVVAAAQNIHVNDQTFAPVKELYKPDADNLEFRIKFEKFTGLHLSSPGIFNQAFPDNLPAQTRKHLALEIYNPDTLPNDNLYLFQNLNADTVELYALYPFKGSFQQLFNGANIKYVRLSSEVRSDLSQPFTGNIGRLELRKQANSLSVQNFPVYPAHELIINAFFIDDFNNEHPPNYNNVGELDVHSNGPIPANAFRNYPNIHTLQISTDQNIDPQAFNGLNKLEKLVIKDGKLPVDLLKNLPNLKEYETNIEKLDEKSQCQLIEKLANGQLAVQAIPNGGQCTCVSAYLDTATGRTPCNAPHCEHSSCAAIKNNYDAGSNTFKAPPQILRADGSNALHPRQPQVYSGPFQVSPQDQEKFQKGTPQQIQPPSGDGSDGSDQGSWQPNQPYNPGRLRTIIDIAFESCRSYRSL